MNNDKLNEIVKRLHGDFFVSCVGIVCATWEINFFVSLITLCVQVGKKILCLVGDCKCQDL